MHRGFIVVAFLFAVALFSAGVWWIGYRAAIVQVADQGSAVLRSASDRLVGQLSRYRTMSVMLADHPSIRDLAAGRAPKMEVEQLLLGIADLSGAVEIALIAPNGARLASSDGQDSMKRITDAAPLARAMTGALGFDNGRTDESSLRYFTFMSPVQTDIGIAGALAVRVDMEAVEESDWRSVPQVVLFTDDTGQIFITNRSELLFLPFSQGSNQSGFGPVREWTIRDLSIWSLAESRYIPKRAVYRELPLPIIGMTGHSLISTASAERIAALQAAVTAALCLAFGAFLFLATERRRTLSEANIRLEARVTERTQELTESNTKLRQEILERQEAEAALRRAQADLVQAGKLSALGQMSAGISHELNQPLMAIQSFSENAQKFLDKDKPEDAHANLGRIAELSRRMGRIIKNLRAFARQEREPMTRVDIVAVIGAVLELAENRISSEGVSIDFDAPSSHQFVRGGEVRLQQVLMNLITNAIDAMAGLSDKRIEIGIEQCGEKICVNVRDTGPGLDDPDKIFDPFYTTKEVGKSEGMGLGLSISYGLVQSFGGAITGRNHPGGGAEFSVELATANDVGIAA